MRNIFFYASTMYCLIGVQESLADTILTRNIAIKLAESKVDSNGTLEIRDGYDEIEERAFDGIDKLKKVSILGIKKIGDFAFANCKNLEIFHVENGKLQTSEYPYIGTNVCAGCEKLSRVAIYNFSLIGDAAFANCANLKSIKIKGGSGGHTSCIGKEAFKMCSSLKDIDLSEVGIISESAFSGCSSLENVKLGEPLNRIEKRVFDGCKNLKTIMLPNYFFEWGGTVDSEAFLGCQNLETIKLFRSSEYPFVFPKSVIIEENGKLITNSGSLVKALKKCGFTNVEHSRLKIWNRKK